MKAIIVGGGFIAKTHIEAIRALGHEVVLLIGRDPEKTELFASENNIPTWTADLQAGLKAEADMVHICTPPHTHAEIIRKALASGKHIVCEKPLCIDPDEAKALAEEAAAAYKDKGIVTALCCNVRYYPANIEAATRIKSGNAAPDSGKGSIGASAQVQNAQTQNIQTQNTNVRLLNGTYYQEFHIPPHPAGWRFDDALSGGMRAITEIGTHWIDLAYAWTGLKITEVASSLGNWYPVRYLKDGMLTEGETGESIDINKGESVSTNGEAVNINNEDAAAVLMKFENGAIGTLLLSETSPGHANDLSIEVSDLKISYKWEEAEPEALQYSESHEMKRALCPVTDRDETFVNLFKEVYTAAENGLKEVYAAAENGLNEGESNKKSSGGNAGYTSFPSFADGAYIAAVCTAIKQSAESKSWVSVPID